MDPFAALADPVRRALLQQLVAGRARVVDLAAPHPISRPAISRHLRVLTEAGLVEATDHGRERHYVLLHRADGFDQVRTLLDDLTERPAPITSHHLDALETEVRRTARDRRSPVPDIAPPEERTA